MSNGADSANDREMSERRKALADPVRCRILRLLRDAPGGLSAREMAQAIGKETNRLYYHLRILESADIVEAKRSRPAGRMLERVFTLSDPDRRYTWDPADPIEMAAHFSAQLQVEREDTEKILFERATLAEQGDAIPSVYWASPTIVNTTHAEIEEFSTRLQALLEEFRHRRDEMQKNETPKDALRDLAFYFIVREEPPSVGA